MFFLFRALPYKSLIYVSQIMAGVPFNFTGNSTKEDIRKSIIEGTAAYALASLLNTDIREVMMDYDQLCPLDTEHAARIDDLANQLYDYESDLLLNYTESTPEERRVSPLLMLMNIDENYLEAFNTNVIMHNIEGMERKTLEDTPDEKLQEFFKKKNERREGMPSSKGTKLADSPGGVKKNRKDIDTAKPKRLFLLGTPSGSAKSSEGSAKRSKASAERPEGSAKSPEGSAKRSKASAERPEASAKSSEGSTKSPDRNFVGRGSSHLYKSPLRKSPPMTMENFNYQFPYAKYILDRIESGTMTLAIHSVMKDKIISIPNADVLGPLAPAYRARVNTAWALIQRLNPKYAIHLRDWMLDDVGRSLISQYMRTVVDPPKSNYMTGHEIRATKRRRITLEGTIRRFKPKTTNSDESVEFFTKLNGRAADRGIYDPAFCMLGNVLPSTVDI